MKKFLNLVLISVFLFSLTNCSKNAVKKPEETKKGISDKVLLDETQNYQKIKNELEAAKKEKEGINSELDRLQKELNNKKAEIERMRQEIQKLEDMKKKLDNGEL